MYGTPSKRKYNQWVYDYSMLYSSHIHAYLHSPNTPTTSACKPLQGFRSDLVHQSSIHGCQISPLLVQAMECIAGEQVSLEHALLSAALLQGDSHSADPVQPEDELLAPPQSFRRCQLFLGKTLLVAAVLLPSRGHEFSCMADSPSMMDSSGYPIRGPNQDRCSGRNIDSLLATSCGDGNARAVVSSYRERKRE